MEIPKWLDEPVQVMINCTKVVPVPTHDEFVVQFSAMGEDFMYMVPTNCVDHTNKGLHASIIGKLSDGSYLVSVPGESFTSGSRILVSEAEKDKVLSPFNGLNAYGS